MSNTEPKKARVKSVLSGDTLVLMAKPTKGKVLEITLTLSNIQAPRLGKTDTAEEPFAFKSREYLRKLVIGKTVTFTSDSRVASIGKDFGTVYLNGENLSKVIVASGWARAKTGNNSTLSSEELSSYSLLENNAIAQNIGIFGPDGASTIRTIQSTMEANEINSFLAKHKNKMTKVIVEYVKDGSSLRCFVPSTNHLIYVSIAGVSCPKFTKSEGKTSEEEFAREAQYFTEIRLLNREIDVIFQGTDKYSNFFGTFCHPKGNIAVELLKYGLAKISDWNLSNLPHDLVIAMRHAEKHAKQSLLRIWKNYIPQELSQKEYSGTVIEVVSGDSVIVMIGNVEKRVYLSSIKAPRLGNSKKEVHDEPYAYQSKEFLRTNIIGQNVNVIVDYERKPFKIDSKTESKTERKENEKTEEDKTCVSLILKNGLNISELLVKEGFASVLKHKGGEDRSYFYDNLINCELEAKLHKRGIFSTKPSPSHKINDLTNDSKKARNYMPFLTRENALKGYVDFVFSASRFKIYVPSENCMLMMTLSSIRTPQTSRTPTKPSAPFADEAKAFSRKHLMQRNVEIGISDVDKNGVFIGRLEVLGNDKHDYCLDLLRLGYGKIDKKSIKTNQFKLEQASLHAQNNKLGVWSIEEVVLEEDDEAKSDFETINIKVSEIIDSGHFFCQDTNNTNLSFIEEQMKAFTAEVGTTTGAPVATKKGTLICALFNDGTGFQYYRAKIETISGSKLGVLFLDYGNRANVEMNQVRPLDDKYSKIPYCARECVLAFVKSPSVDADYGKESATYFHNLVWGKDLIGQIFKRDALGRNTVTLYLEEDSKSVAERLIEQGLARVEKGSSRVAQRLSESAQDYLEKLQGAQESAHVNREGMWRYGDVASDDEY